MSADQVRAYVDGALEAFPSIRAVVFTGGECFLLGDGLTQGIERATRAGRATRCVTNGYWATSRVAAERRLGPLVGAGLMELNFSTGDEHQRFVPFDRVATAAVASAEMGLTTLVNVESTPTSTFTLEDARKHPTVAGYLGRSEAAGKLLLVQSVWVDLVDRGVGLKSSGAATQACARNAGGCESLFDTVAIEPGGHLLACCGLTATQTPELVLGRWNTPEGLRSAYEGQFLDVLKLWLSLDGPDRVHQVLDGRTEVPGGEHHRCQSCLALHRRPDLLAQMVTRAPSLVPDLAFRFTIRESLVERNALKPTINPGPGA